MINGGFRKIKSGTMSRDVVKLYWPAEQCSVSALSKHAVKRNCPYIIIDDSHGFSSVSKYRGNREANTAHAVLQLIPKKVSQRNCFTDAVFKCVQRIREFVYRREFGRDPKTRLNTNVIPPSYLTSAVLPIVGKRDSPAIIRPRASNLYPLGLIRDVWPNAANWPYRNFQACVKPCKTVCALKIWNGSRSIQRSLQPCAGIAQVESPRE